MPTKRPEQRRGIHALDTMIPNPDSRTAERPLSIVAEQPDSEIAEQQNSQPKARSRRNTKDTSWGVQVSHELRDAARLLTIKRKVTMGQLMTEAIIDVLRKYGEPIPEGPGER